MHFNIHNLLQQYGYLGVFLAFLLEMIGIPFPGETILTLLGIEWKQGNFSLLTLIISAAAGNIIGSSISYLIGRFLGRAVILRFGKLFRITEQKLNAADEKFNRYRAAVVLFGKFIAGIRVIAAYLAGINRMDFLKFSFYNSVGSLLWIIVFILFGRYVDIAWNRFQQMHILFILLIISVFLLTFLSTALYKRKLKREFEKMIRH